MSTTFSKVHPSYRNCPFTNSCPLYTFKTSRKECPGRLTLIEARLVSSPWTGLELTTIIRGRNHQFSVENSETQVSRIFLHQTDESTKSTGSYSAPRFQRSHIAKSKSTIGEQCLLKVLQSIFLLFQIFQEYIKKENYAGSSNISAWGILRPSAILVKISEPEFDWLKKTIFL